MLNDPSFLREAALIGGDWIAAGAEAIVVSKSARGR
jgi:hypothetical protein